MQVLSVPLSRLPALRQSYSDSLDDAEDPINTPLQARLLATLLDEIDNGVLVCDERGTVRTANWEAQRELDCGRLLHASGGSLCSHASDGGLSAAIRAACNRGRRQIVALRKGEDRLYASVSPLPTPDGPPLALVMLGRRESCSRHGLDLLGIQHGLTPAERRVLVGLVAQRSPAQIANDHYVALSTVRTQIGALRAKFGVKSLQALLCLVSSVPPLAMALRLTSDNDAPQRSPFTARRANAA